MATFKDFLMVEKPWNTDGTRPPSSAHVARIEPLSVQRANVCKNRASLEPSGTRAILQEQNQGKNHPKSAHKKPWNTHSKRVFSVSHAAHQRDTRTTSRSCPARPQGATRQPPKHAHTHTSCTPHALMRHASHVRTHDTSHTHMTRTARKQRAAQNNIN